MDILYILISLIWPFVFVFNLINAIRDERGSMNFSRKASATWAAIGFLMVTVWPSIYGWIITLQSES